MREWVRVRVWVRVRAAWGMGGEVRGKASLCLVASACMPWHGGGE